MKSNFYLTVNSRGGVKVTKNRPNVDFDEISIRMDLDVPDMLFKKPQLTASITIPESAAVPKEIDVEMQDNIQNAIETATGLNVRLTIQKEEE